MLKIFSVTTFADSKPKKFFVQYVVVDSDREVNSNSAEVFATSSTEAKEKVKKKIDPNNICKWFWINAYPQGKRTAEQLKKDSEKLKKAKGKAKDYLED